MDRVQTVESAEEDDRKRSPSWPRRLSRDKTGIFVEAPLMRKRRRCALANSRSRIANLSMRVLARFLAAASDGAHFPAPSLPEVAFLGRSNVGKSSVINSLIGSKLARTSSTPGRTRSINFFEIRWPGKPRPELIFADLPGYGYAKISREISQEWPSFIEPYLKLRPTLALCVALIDINIAPQASDQQLLDFLNALGHEFVLVATKSDRLSNNQLHSALRSLSERYSAAQVIAYSAKTGKGRDELWAQIRHGAQTLTESPVNTAGRMD
jgi:GTP-binding protein